MSDIVQAHARPRWRSALIGASLALLLAACSPHSSEADAASQQASQTAEATAAPLSATGVPEPTGEVTFIVRFSADHPLARAQTLEASGRGPEAERLARETISEDFSLYGLCFQRFTLSGAEIVLVGCTSPQVGREGVFRELWLSRFSDMAGVEYAETNVIANASRPPV